MPSPATLRRDRLLFYTGLVLLLLGGPGLVLGTFGHDAWRVPVVGEAYGAFGWINQTVLAIGAVVLLVGILLTALGVRGGVISDAEASTGGAKS